VTRVFVCAESVLELDRLAALVRSAPSLQLVGTCQGTSGLHEQMADAHADVLLEHYTAAGTDEFELAEFADARFEGGSTAIAKVALVPESAYNAALTAIQGAGVLAGALRVVLRGVLPTWASEKEICGAITAAGQGLLVLHPDVLEQALLPSAAPPSAAGDSMEGALSPRESEILNLLAAGLGNKEIASQLKSSEHTVKFHVTSIFNKLSASTRAEAVAVGMRRGLIIL
jgi:NarL family two-component system response regulator YdfI